MRRLRAKSLAVPSGRTPSAARRPGEHARGRREGAVATADHDPLGASWSEGATDRSPPRRACSPGRARPWGCLPLGTANDFARTLHIPDDLEGALRVVARGAERAVDVAWLAIGRS